MEDLFFEANSGFEGSMMHINNCLESAIFTYTDELLTNHYVTEAVKDSLWTKLKQFFTKIILSLKSFTKELQLKFEYTIKEKQIKKKLTQLREDLKEKQSTQNNVKMIDYWEMKRIFNKYYDDLIKYAKKFSKVKYTKTWQIEDDLDSFNKLLDKCNEELEKVADTKITVSITKALDFVEDEIRGKSDVLSSLNDSIRDFAEIEQIAEELKTRMNILGADVIPRHVGFIQKMVNAIGGFVRKWTVKFIMGIVFIFTF
jgi:hypothetical protein